MSMPDAELTVEDCDLIIASLSFTEQKFRTNAYGSEDVRQSRLADVDRATTRVRAVRRRLRAQVGADAEDPVQSR